MPRKIRQEVGFSNYVEAVGGVGNSLPKPYRTATRTEGDEVRISGSLLKTVRQLDLPHRIVAYGRRQGFGVVPPWVMTVVPWLSYWVNRGAVYVYAGLEEGEADYCDEKRAAQLALHAGVRAQFVLDWEEALVQIRTGSLGPAIATVLVTHPSGSGAQRLVFDLLPRKPVKART